MQNLKKLKILETSNTLLSLQWQQINEVQATGSDSGEPDTLDMSLVWNPALATGRDWPTGRACTFFQVIGCFHDRLLEEC